MKVVTLTDSTLLGLLKNNAFTATNPTLSAQAAKLASIKGCSCSSKNAAARRAVLAETKSVISAFPTVQEAVKLHLKAARIRLYVGRKLVEY